MNPVGAAAASRSASFIPSSINTPSAATRVRSAVATSSTFPIAAVTPGPDGIVPGVGKGMPKWPEVWEWLNYEKRMQTVDSAEAVAMMRKGAVLLDVRFDPDYEKWSIPGSVHVPYVTGGILAKMRLPGFKRKNEDFVRLVREAECAEPAEILTHVLAPLELGVDRRLLRLRLLHRVLLQLVGVLLVRLDLRP